MTEWRSAWKSGSSDSMASLYAEGALFSPSGGPPIAGREAIRRYLSETLQPSGDVGVSIADFGVGEEVAYQLGNYRYIESTGETAPQAFGRHVTISARYGREWRIRAQLLLPDEESGRLAPVGGAAASLEPLTPDRLEGSGRLRAGFQQRLLARSNAVLAAWRDSWRRDDVEAAAVVFAIEGLLLLPGEEPVKGRAQIHSRLTDLLPAIGDLHATVVDFEATHGLAYAYGRYYCQCRTFGGNVLGHYLSVLSSDDSDWRIRALVLWVDPEGG